MPNRLDGKTALVTAAGQGIGEAIARTFATEGAKVVATDRNPELLANYDGVAGVTTTVLDVLSPIQIDGVFEAAGALDVLVNCAGFVHHGTVLDATESEWDFAFDLNVKSIFRTINAALPAMLEAGHGSIVNIASVASSIKGVPLRCVYGASKAAVIGLTKSVAADFVGSGIRCNAICPGTVQSPSLEDRIAAQGGDARQAFLDRQPMGRFGTPQEIAFLATYLASDESGFTTGAVEVIDGGWVI